MFAACTLGPLVWLAVPLMDIVFERITDPRYGSLAAASALFIIPTVILGIISPYSVRLLVKEVAASGRVAGYLYFVSTLGSALGTLATSFYLVLWFEINTIILGLCGALLVLAVTALIAPAPPQYEPHEHA